MHRCCSSGTAFVITSLISIPVFVGCGFKRKRATRAEGQCCLLVILFNVTDVAACGLLDYWCCVGSC